MKNKVCLGIVLVVLVLAISLPEFTSTASAQPESDWFAHPLIHVWPAATTSPTGLSPTQIRKAYNLPSTGGTGTIAIVDAYDCPTVLNDLNVFSNTFQLPAPNFEKYKMSSTIRVDSGWALEISLDVQWAHAIAPNAKILLVEAKSNSFNDLLTAVNYARNRPDVVAISMSWGGNEFYTETRYNSYFTSSYGATFFAASGDWGAGVIWPSSSPNVVAVGGTTLTLASDGTVISETAWSGSGGGRSAYEAEPDYQLTYGVPNANGKRAVPDVSYNANPASGVSVYDSTPYSGQSGWFKVGGTSAGAPQWAAIHSLGLSASNNNFYQDAKSSYASYFRDITTGSNGAYSATAGYDYVTGLGSPLTTNYAPATTPDFSISASPNALTIPSGSSGSSTITVAPLKGFSSTVSLAANPPGWAALNPVSITGGGTAALTITVPLGTAAGTYTVTVTGTSGSLSHSIPITVNVQTVPSAPQNLKATAGEAKVTLSWSAPSDTGGSAIVNYKIYKATAPGQETYLATIGNVLTYTDTAVTAGQIYYYQVAAVNSIGESTKSNEASATPSEPVVNTLSVTVKTDKSTYSKRSTVTATVTVTDSTNHPIQGATVRVTIYNQFGSAVWIGSGTTGSNGQVQLSYRSIRDQAGTYTVVAVASLAGYQTGTGQTTFNIV